MNRSKACKRAFTTMLTAAIAATSLSLFAPAAHAALGGPVILGGDDLTDHGSISGATLQNGWLYIRKALENLKPNVTRPNNGKVAVLGAADSIATSANAGAAYHHAAPQAGLTPQFVDGAAAINTFFGALVAGTENPAILVMAGTGAANNLDVSEGSALTANAVRIANFVNSGGGLLAHGSGSVAYGWLKALLPGANEVLACSTPLTLTAAGQTAFPGLTNANVSSGPCHSSFSGDLGNLQVLAKDTGGRNAIIGGAAVQLPGSITLTPVTSTGPVNSSHTVTATAKNGDNSPAAGATVTFTVASGPNAGTTGSAVADASGQATFTYTGSGGAGTDQIQATFVDSTGTTQTSPTVQRTWEAPVNRPPVANDDSYTTAEDTALGVLPPGVTANDTDPDSNPLTASLVSGVSNGTLVFNADGSFTYTPAANWSGTDTFTYRVNDGTVDSNVATATITVTPVNDPPSCATVVADASTLWPPNHRLVTVTLSGGSDIEGGPVTIKVTGVTQDEPVNGLGDGDTGPDAVAGASLNQVSVRAERSGTGDGRVYVVSYTASDPDGGSCSGTIVVTVPHDQGKGSTAVDSGQAYNSFGS